jgi:hypothetical protein
MATPVPAPLSTPVDANPDDLLRLHPVAHTGGYSPTRSDASPDASPTPVPTRQSDARMLPPFTPVPTQPQLGSHYKDDPSFRIRLKKVREEDYNYVVRRKAIAKLLP